MIRSILTVSTGTLASRLLGFARDSLIAALLGTGAVADAFLAAFQLVNVVRRLLSEGALNAALIPAWLRVRDRDGEAAAAAFAGRVLGTVSAGLIAISIAIAVLMPLIIMIIAPGFVGSATLDLAVQNARLMLPYLAFAGPVTVLMGLLNAQGRFALTAFSPLLFNIALIAAIAALLLWHADATFAARMLAAIVGIAGLLQLLMLLSQRSARLATPLRASFDQEMRGFFAKAIPGMIAGSGPQWLMVAGAIIASATPAAVSWLYFANRLIELPLGIVGVAMGTVLVPELTRAVSSGDRDAVAHAESRALELATGLALPATLGLIVLAKPIVRMLFEHGAFGAEDSAATARALMWLALGLPAHVLIKALSPAFYARGDTDDAAAGNGQRLCGRDRACRRARALLRCDGNRREHCGRRLEQRDLPAPERHGRIRLLGRCRRSQAAAPDRARRSRHGRPALADCGSCACRSPSPDPLHCAGPADRGGDHRLWHAPASPRRRFLARGG
ncbi:putative peptidoglycan lipid II flippase [Bradyrhizobium sp. LB13.1]